MFATTSQWVHDFFSFFQEDNFLFGFHPRNTMYVSLITNVTKMNILHYEYIRFYKKYYNDIRAY